MPIPAGLIAGAIGVKALSGLVSSGANLYSQKKQRDLFRYQKNAYDRQYSDWQKNVPGRKIRYPELSYPGRSYAADIGISQSYASSVSTAAGGVGDVANGIRSTGSLYSKSVGRTSKYL